jgi:hypothetical protein
MAIDERSRHAMYLRLEEVLGAEQATTLMEHLPPVGWADVATRRDIEMLRVATTHDVESLRRDLGATEKYVLGTLRSEIAQAFSAQTRTLVMTQLGSVVAAVALAFGAAKLG